MKVYILCIYSIFCMYTFLAIHPWEVFGSSFGDPWVKVRNESEKTPKVQAQPAITTV